MIIQHRANTHKRMYDMKSLPDVDHQQNNHSLDL